MMKKINWSLVISTALGIALATAIVTPLAMAAVNKAKTVAKV